MANKKLSKKQREVLGAIDALPALTHFGDDVKAFFDGPVSRRLIALGMIERCDRCQQYDGLCSFTSHLCRLTTAGRDLLNKEGK